MKFNTPLRYPGGKDRLTGFIKTVFEQNYLLDGHYVELYAGSAGIALNLLTHGYVSHIHLNDVNPAIYAFWHSAINHPEALCKAIHGAKITMEEWQRQKAILNSPKNHSLLEVGFSIFYLYRVNSLGILWGGTIGRENQTGHWRLDARFNKADLIRRIEWIALHRSLIRLYNLDAADLIKTISPTLPDKTLIYLDPPRYAKGQWLCEDHYLHNVHVDIANLIKEYVTHHWIVSCDRTPGIIEMFKDYPTTTCHTDYDARDRYNVAEVMFFSKKLVIPSMKNPSNLKTA
jgi:DNA adenine methylase